MREDELQVLGISNNRKKYKMWAIIAVCLAIVVMLFWLFTTGKTGKELVMTAEGTTISPALQDVADSLLEDKLKEIDGLQGQIIVMEVGTGAIKAIVGQERKFDGCFTSCENFAYQQELGSLAKTASLLAALETGEVKLSDVVDTGNGVWDLGDIVMKDHNWRRGGYELVTLDRALEISSNIGISKAVREAFKGDEQGYFDKLAKMSYGKPDSVVGIIGIKPNKFISPKDSDWTSHSLLWHAIGYNRKMAPIQMLTFYNAIANNGKMVSPTLVPGDISVINEQIAKKENIAEIRRALRQVVTQGLGKLAEAKTISVAGNPATSEVNRVYGEGDSFVSEYQLAFCGYFPAEDPKFSMIVSLNKLGLPASGAFAEPLFRQIADWMYDHGMYKKEKNEK